MILILLRRIKMAYVSPNYKTKKALKDAVAKGATITVYSPGPFGCAQQGWEFVEGPHYPEPHRWYAQVWIEAGRVTKVK
jgi:hypothetical protein